MANSISGWKRQGEAFWREHHERWKRSDLNQREYCEAMNLPLKSFSNWRCMFRKEPEPFKRKLLYRRGGLKHSLSHTLSPTLNHGAYGRRSGREFRHPWHTGDRTRSRDATHLPDRSALRETWRRG